MRHGTPEGKTAIQCTYTYTLALITKNPSGGRWDKKKTTENSRTKVLTYLHMFVLFWLTAITLHIPRRESLCIYLPLESSIQPIACGTGVNRVTTLHTYFSNYVDQVAKTLA